MLMYLHEEGFPSREAWVAAIQPPAPTFERTEQPPFATLPPLVGGALDALVAFGNYAAAGIPLPSLVSSDTREYMGELKERSPGGVQAAGIAGGLAGGLAATPLFAARMAATGPYQVATGANAMQAAPSLAGAAAGRAGSAIASGARSVAPMLSSTLKSAAKGGLGLLGLDAYLKWRGLLGGR